MATQASGYNDIPFKAKNWEKYPVISSMVLKIIPKQIT